MNNRTDGDMIKQYAVKIIYKNFKKKRQGSGVLIRVNDSTCYLLTARHNFKERDDDTFIDVDIEGLTEALDLIHITKDSLDKICEIESLVYSRDDIDLVVFLIKNPSTIVERIPPFDMLLKDERFYKEEHFFFGYRKNKKGLPEDDLRNIGENEGTSNFILKRGLSIRNQHYYSGYSGSGVFIKKEEVFYLVGIVVMADDEVDNYEAINLSKVIEDINDNLKLLFLPEISIQENIFEILDIEKMYSQIFYRHPNNFLLKETNGLFEKNHIYKELIEPSEKLKNLSSFMDSTNEFHKLEVKYTQELADMYLVATFISSKYEQDKIKAKQYFEKACKYRKDYRFFLTEIDKENSKAELLELGKIKYLDDEYMDAKKCFEKVLSLKCTRDETIKLNLYLLKIAKEANDKKEEFYIYLKLYELYNDGENLKKAEICYKLSFIFEDKEDQVKVLNKGNEHLNNSIESLEIEYKILKKLILLTKVKKAYKQQVDILERLVPYKSQYQEELLALKNRRHINVIFIWIIVTLIIAGILILVSFELLDKEIVNWLNKELNSIIISFKNFFR